MSIVNVLDTGAKGDGKTLDTGAMQAAIDWVHENGGGTVIIPGGHKFLCGTIRLKSFVDFHLEPGSTLLASTSQDDYAHSTSSCLIEAVRAEHVSITGFGCIDGRSSSFVAQDLGYIFKPTAWRPGLVFLLDCTRLTLRDVTFTSSPHWTVHPVGCEDVLINGIHIYNSLKMPNCDGIDPDHCRNVRISDCHIQCADDCIVVKNTAPFADRGTCSDIAITGCTLMCTATAVKIGTETVTDVQNVTVSACTIKSSSRGLGIQLRDQGHVRNVIVTNCTIETRVFDDPYWGKAEPIHISAVHRFSGDPGFGPPEWNPENKLGTIKHVLFSNILCHSENGVFIAGEPDIPIENIVLRNIVLEIDKWTKWPGGRHDRRPMDGPSHALRGGKTVPGVTEHPSCGVFIEHARDIELDGVQVVWGEDLPAYYTHALEAHHAPGLRITHFRGEAAHPDRDEAIVVTGE